MEKSDSGEHRGIQRCYKSALRSSLLSRLKDEGLLLFIREARLELELIGK